MKNSNGNHWRGRGGGRENDSCSCSLDRVIVELFLSFLSPLSFLSSSRELKERDDDSFFFFLQLDFATPPRGFFVEISSSNYGRRNEWERNCEGYDLMRSGERYGARKLGGARLDISVAICGELIKRGECNLDMRQYEICIRYYIGGCEERDFEEDSLELVDILIRLILWINHPRCPPSRNLFSNFLWIKKKGDFFFFYQSRSLTCSVFIAAPSRISWWSVPEPLTIPDPAPALPLPFPPTPPAGVCGKLWKREKQC